MKVTRASFEAVFDSQERLRNLLDQLIKENRPLKDTDERNEYMKLLAFATIGLGTNHTTRLDLEDGTFLDRDLETVARWAAYLHDQEIEIPLTIGKRSRKTTRVKISVIWTVIRDDLLSTYPFALERSWGQSQELKSSARGQGHNISQRPPEAS